MKQIMKRALLVLCMAVCILSLAACGKKEDASAEQIPQEIENTMKSGALDYLARFDSYDDATIASELKRVEKQKNEVMISALTSWENVKGDLGKMAAGTGAVLSQEVTRVGDDGYKIVARVSYEMKEMDFTLSAKEVIGSNGQTVLTPTELIFAPRYTTGEKLTRAGMNTLMGMGTVFAVLIFMCFIISTLKGVNSWEAKRAEKLAASENGASAPAPVATAPVVASPAPAVVSPAPAAALAAPIQAPIASESVNLADDMELVAVITAAIAATQCVPVEGLVVRSIRRKPASTWKNA